MSELKSNDRSGFSTDAIHHGYEQLEQHGSLIPPIYMTSTYAFKNVDQGAARFSGEEAGHFYSRISNPTTDILEQRFAKLENAEAALGFSSGMGAITSVFWTLLESGDEIIIDKTLYACTYAFISHGLKKFGIKVTQIDMTDLKQLEAVLTAKTKIVFFETPTNPNMRLIDITAVSATVKKFNARVIVDNTYATPYLTNPLSLGADIVVHSATKYISGHGDLIAGLAAGSAELIQQVRLEGLKDMTGAVMTPLTAHQLMRGLKTLELRMQRHCKNAQKIAELLESHPFIEDVYFPGLNSFPQKELAQRQMKDTGGMLAFTLKDLGYGQLEAGKQMMNALSMIRLAVSLGDAETLIQHPASMVHSVCTPDERKALGIDDGLVRLSVGLESVDDIWNDLSQALKSVSIQERAA